MDRIASTEVNLTDQDIDIISYRQHGYTRRQIKEQLGISTTCLNIILKRLMNNGYIQRGLRGGNRNRKGSGRHSNNPYYPILCEALIGLRNQDATMDEIVSIVGMARGQIHRLIQQLIQQGKIAQLQPGRPYWHEPICVKDEWRDLGVKMTGARYEELKSIIALRQFGYKNADIAQKLNIPTSRLNRRIYELVKQDQLTPLPPGRPFTSKNMVCPSLTIEDPINQKVIALVRCELSTLEIGKLIGCSGEWVRKHKIKLLKHYGESIFQNPATKKA